MSDTRKAVLLKALEAEIGADSADVEHLFVGRCRRLVALGDRVGTGGKMELSAEHDTSFSNVVLSIRGAR